MHNIEYPNLWGFIVKYLPNYYYRDDVLQSDILFRYIDGDEVCEDDIEQIRKEFGTDIGVIKKECLRLEKQFLSEALDCFYAQRMRGIF